jgi:hypothetical protein
MCPCLPSSPQPSAAHVFLEATSVALLPVIILSHTTATLKQREDPARSDEAVCKPVPVLDSVTLLTPCCSSNTEVGLAVDWDCCIQSPNPEKAAMVVVSCGDSKRGAWKHLNATAP